MTSNRSARARSVADESPVPHCVLADGTISYANAALGTLLGVDAESLVGERFLAYVAADERDRVDDALSGVADGDVSIRFELDGPPDGRTVVESEWTEREESDAWLGTLRDVTDRVERERRLERESEMLDSLLEHVPIAVYFKDRKGRHERVSQHAICPTADGGDGVVGPDGKIHHHPADVHGKTDFGLFEAEYAEAVAAEEQRIMEEEETVRNEVQEVATPLGETYFYSETKVPRYDDEGEVIGIVGVTLDITDRMTYERELERQNERLEEFTEVLAHDLRNPLTVARSNLQTIDADVDHPQLEPTLDAVDRISALIEEVRTFVIEGRTVEDPDVADLATAAEDAWKSVDTGSADLEIAASNRIRADYDRLQRLLENVFRNAVEHGSTSPDSQDRQDPIEHATDSDGAVTVTVGDTETGFYVADDGPGVPEDLRDEVFERGVTTSDEGTGFGLAIVRNIARAHDWSVDVTDAADGGARIEVTGVVRVEDGSTGHL
ncbi:PAS domain-containing sensor histidine kinase [Halomicrobium salinisoli]|uniref:PAS domain-containing sensor histidine kinase n=1 Tax=Halomicrobium salinisoli TaxID=2878391 RepID=UPI001CF07C05|nr:PAS domain-containing protein [Halomicrobium salinisoli]